VLYTNCCLRDEVIVKLELVKLFMLILVVNNSGGKMHGVWASTLSQLALRASLNFFL